MAFLVPTENALVAADPSNVASMAASAQARDDAIRRARVGVFAGALVGMLGGSFFALRENRMLSVLTATVGPLAGYMIGHQTAVAKWRENPLLWKPTP